jgi:uncharacterized protein YuzE
MKIEYSEDVDALYVYLQEVEVARSVEPGDGIVVDYDASGAIVGVEILDASDRLNPVDAALMLKDSGRTTPKTNQPRSGPLCPFMPAPRHLLRTTSIRAMRPS